MCPPSRWAGAESGDRMEETLCICGGGGSGEGMGAWEGRSSKAEPYSASSGQPERSGGVTAGW